MKLSTSGIILWLNNRFLLIEVVELFHKCLTGHLKIFYNQTQAICVVVVQVHVISVLVHDGQHLRAAEIGRSFEDGRSPVPTFFTHDFGEAEVDKDSPIIYETVYGVLGLDVEVHDLEVVQQGQ